MKMNKTLLLKLLSASAVFLCFSVYADAISELQQIFAKHTSMSAAFNQQVTKSNGEVVSSAEVDSVAVSSSPVSAGTSAVSSGPE